MRRLTVYGLVELARRVHEAVDDRFRGQTPDDTLQGIMHRLGRHNTTDAIEERGAMALGSGLTRSGLRVVICAGEGWLASDHAPTHLDID